MFSQTVMLATSAAFVGLVHSLAPGHWLPVVLMAKSRKWNIPASIIGAVVAASGHIFLSLVLSLVAIQAGATFLSEYEETIEHYSAFGLILFGLAYAAYAWRSHSHCHGHEHHGPNPKRSSAPYLFLFSLGFSPCIAALPVFVAAAAKGAFAVTLAMAAFAGGVLAALIGATLLVTLGIAKVDHPVLEHHGDVITGVAVATIGALMLFVPMH